MKPIGLIGLMFPSASLEGQMSNSGITNQLTLREELPKICTRLFQEIGSQQLEATYQKCLAIDLLEAGVEQVHTEVKFPLTYKGHVVGNRRADMILDLTSGERAIVELKTVDGKMWLRHRTQLEYYMHYANIDDGYLINFPHDDIFPLVSDKSSFEYELLVGYQNMTQHLLNSLSRLHLRNTPGQREVEVIHIRRSQQLEDTKSSMPGSPLFGRLLEDRSANAMQSLESQLKKMPF